ncbi:hypothetical protein Bca4012_046043 [Brassica carinata]|uniref:Uncharacterized protein n=1 Tax=Brassica carinata TaxID=52824 RepID=A0A8X7QQ83_BRACI|nr:hypothetical protein Bca52824_056331 [Brassica carinata]KAG2273778.1 hypothetical protein Bca52824_056333 [Brassica carinata]
MVSSTPCRNPLLPAKITCGLHGLLKPSHDPSSPPQVRFSCPRHEAALHLEIGDHGWSSLSPLLCSTTKLSAAAPPPRICNFSQLWQDQSRAQLSSLALTGAHSRRLALNPPW